MSLPIFWRKARMALVTLGLAGLLTGCLFSPGKFDARLDIRNDGTFTYAYKGQIFLFALSRLADMGKAALEQEEFVAQDCYDDEGEWRECEDKEIEEQKADWEQANATKLEENRRNMEALKEFLGGIDPGSPEAAQELADRMSKQDGWNSVTYAGDGIFEVDFSITGRTSHDFAFPTFERFPNANSFMTMIRRKDGAMRIDAQGFTAKSGGSSPLASLLEAAAIASKYAKPIPGDDQPVASMPELDGTFTIVTDAQILANNTDDGPKADAAGQSLTWEINRRTTIAPMAMIRPAQ